MRPDYVGFEIPDVFVVGYGLDYNDAYRNLPFLAALGVGRHRSAASCLTPISHGTTPPGDLDAAILAAGWRPADCTCCGWPNRWRRSGHRP